MGLNIYLRKDGRYEGRIPLSSGETGRKFRYFLDRSREIVCEKMNEYLHNRTGTSGNCTKHFSEIYEEWYNDISHRVNESTCANYALKANKHLLPYFGDLPISEITEDDIYAFIELKQNQSLSTRYIADIIGVVKALFKFAVKTCHIINPTENVSLPKRSKPEIRLLDSGEQEKLQGYIAQNHNKTTMGVALSMTTGVRIGELCALQWKDIDLEKRILTVRKTMQRVQTPNGETRTKLIITDPKSESSKRVIPITQNMADFLAEFKCSENDYVLSGCEKPVEPRSMQYRFAKILKNVNLPSVHFHALRHIFASTCVKLGFDVKALSELLGHSSVEITLNRYVHSSFEQKKEYMDRLQFSF